MPETMLTERRPEPNAVGEPRVFDKLRELVRSGYALDPDPGPGGGMLLRHDSAPDLILHPDGRIDLPLAQRPKHSAPLSPPLAGKRHMSKRRTF
ncbi:MAG TPA: hypothetical protein VGB04_07965 [Allosphingosinicella sp.]|jgi:hypothetical protein